MIYRDDRNQLQEDLNIYYEVLELLEGMEYYAPEMAATLEELRGGVSEMIELIKNNLEIL